MTLPLIILALLAALAGVLGIPHALGGHNWIHQWLASEGGLGEAAHGSEGMERILAGASVLWALMWAMVALTIYTKRLDWVRGVVERSRALYRLIWNKYYIDEIYDRLIVRPIHWLSQNLLWRFVDMGLIDGLMVNGSARLSQFFGQAMGILQTGILNSYAFYFLVALVGLGFWVWRFG